MEHKFNFEKYQQKKELKIKKYENKEKLKDKNFKSLSSADKDYLLFLMAKELGLLPYDMDFK